MRFRLVAILCLASVIVGACNFPRATGTPGPVARVGDTPAATPPVPEQYLTGVRVVAYDPFDNMHSWRSQNATGTLTDGVFELRGTPAWHSHLELKKQFSEGEGMMISFKLKRADANSEFVFVSGDWLTDSFRQIGVYNAVTPLSDLFQGTTDLGGKRLSGSLQLSPDTYYTVLLAVGHNGRFLAVVWDPANPSNQAVFNAAGDATIWAGRKWTFMPKANKGETIYVDNFYRFSFTGMK